MPLVGIGACVSLQFAGLAACKNYFASVDGSLQLSGHSDSVLARKTFARANLLIYRTGSCIWLELERESRTASCLAQSNTYVFVRDDTVSQA